MSIVKIALSDEDSSLKRSETSEAALNAIRVHARVN